jgi:hypothetical protein
MRTAGYGPQVPGAAAYTACATSDTLPLAAPAHAVLIAAAYALDRAAGGVPELPAFCQAARSRTAACAERWAAVSRVRQSPHVGGVGAAAGGGTSVPAGVRLAAGTAAAGSRKPSRPTIESGGTDGEPAAGRGAADPAGAEPAGPEPAGPEPAGVDRGGTDDPAGPTDDALAAGACAACVPAVFLGPPDSCTATATPTSASTATVSQPHIAARACPVGASFMAPPK